MERAQLLSMPRNEREALLEEQNEQVDDLWDPSAISDQEDEPVTSPYLDDLIHRVTSGGKTTLAREDQDVLNTLKSNMVDPKVRPVVDSADAQKAMRILKKNLAMYSKPAFPGKTPLMNRMTQNLVTILFCPKTLPFICRMKIHRIMLSKAMLIPTMI